jgi:gamma-glutamylcyclotransferase (GGCT)/AIG2-like uncharacterized protein YtfP
LSEACFTYGSLMWADIMARVCGRPLESEPARLSGYRRHPVLGEDYPGIVADSAAVVEGRLYRGLAAEDWRRLDAYEGADYAQTAVTVELPSGGRVAANAYRYLPEQGLGPGDWDVQAFETEGRARFIARYVGFAKVDPPGSSSDGS